MRAERYNPPVQTEIQLTLTQQEASHLAHLLFQQSSLRVGLEGVEGSHAIPGTYPPKSIEHMLTLATRTAQTLSDVLPNVDLSLGMPF